MRAKLFSPLLVLIFSSTSFARFPCELAKEFGNPKIANNAKFWKELEPVMNRGDGKAIATHFKKYGVNPGPAAPAQAVARTPAVPTQSAYRMTPSAAKELKAVPPAARKGLDGVLYQLRRSNQRAFYADLKVTPGSVSIEKLADGTRAMSVRTADDYKVIYREVGDHFEIVSFAKIR